MSFIKTKVAALIKRHPKLVKLSKRSNYNHKRLASYGMTVIETPITNEEYALLKQFVKDKKLSSVEILFRDYVKKIMQENFDYDTYSKWDKIELRAETQNTWKGQ